MEDVAYYDSQLQYQKRVGEIEKERLRLEREMFLMMKSDKKLQNLRAAKLRSYWQQVCEREKKAKERNEDLLRDFEQLEIKLLAMEAKTNKLRKMKMEYDEKIKQMYPKWRQEVEMTRAKKQLQERGISLDHRIETRTSPRDYQPLKTTDISLPPTKAPTGPMEISPSQQRKSPTRTPDVTSLFSASASVATPSKTPATSTPKSRQVAIESVRPPESFADSVPVQQVSQVTTTSVIESPRRSTNVVHTIPTAFASEGANSDFSDTSLLSEKAEKPAESPPRIPSSTGHPVDSTGHPESEKSAPTPSHTLSGVVTSRDSHAKPSSPMGGHSSTAMSNISPKRIQQSASPVTAVSEHKEKIQSPEPRPESKLSISSFGSDDLSMGSHASPRGNTSPRPNQPLTANAAYQALLKQHSGTNAKSLEIPEMDEDSDEDDLENLLSPRSTDQQRMREDDSGSDEDETFSDSKRGASPVYIPTAISSGPTSHMRQQQQPRTVPKAPWETDSEDEFGNDNTNLSNTGGSSMWDSKLKKYDPQDDFDFYD